MTRITNRQTEIVKAAPSEVETYVPDDVDYEPPEYEPPPLRRFVGIRQKDLKDESGRVIRPAGSFAFSDPADPEAADVPSLLLSVLQTSHGRVYFEEGKRDPTCKSVDAKSGSVPREGTKYGACDTCELSQFIDGKRPQCRENWDLLCWDISADMPVIFTMTWSGFAVWRGFYQHMVRKANDYPKKDGRAPYVLHLYAVPVGIEFVRKGGWEYYVPKFGAELALPPDQTAKTRDARRLLIDQFRTARAARTERREDYLGEE